MSEELSRNDIPKKFYNENGDGYPVVAKTIGDLKNILAELPDDLAINQDYSDEGGCQVTVFNMSKTFSKAPHLEFQEVEDW